MKKLTILLFAGTVLLFLGACNKEEAPTAEATAAAPTQPSTPTQPSASPAAKPSGTSGTVTETMDAGGYTYVQVDSGKEKIWAAAPEFTVKVGDQVIVPQGMAMNNYHSQTLNRDFPVVYFVESILNASSPTMPQTAANAKIPEGHPAIGGAPTPDDINFSDIVKPAEGMTVGEIYAGKADLADKNITLRGKVVKFTPQIMGTNWIHVQDGSGDKAAGTNDLTVTSKTEVKVGDTITVKGPVTLDKDFGYGYKYNLIMENAEVAAE